MNAQAVAKQTVETMPVATEPASESAAILSVIERMAMNPGIDPELFGLSKYGSKAE